MKAIAQPTDDRGFRIVRTAESMIRTSMDLFVVPIFISCELPIGNTKRTGIEVPRDRVVTITG